jgi:cysteinyl-tRNA synthetase
LALAAHDADSFIVQNITDVGHMADDSNLDTSDSTEDKMLKQAAAEKLSALEIARKYELGFFQDITALNIRTPDQTPRASETIESMIDVIQKLMDKGFAYQGENGSVYFDATKYESYGAISGNTLEQLKPGHRLLDEIDETKRFHGDWALWKITDNRRSELTWQTPWGVGFPGWHIECTAMCLDAFGDQVDIHTGGIDLRFPHHENERAQSNAIVGKEVVGQWVHAEHLLFEGRKMSKSTNNVVLLRDVIDAGISPAAVRLAFLEHHYRQQLNLTWDTLVAAETTIARWSDCIVSDQYNHAISDQITEHLADNLDTPTAIMAIRGLEKSLAKSPKERSMMLNAASRMLGLDLAKPKLVIDDSVIKLVQEREIARANKDFNLSDQLRDQITTAGYWVNDTSSGPVIRRSIKLP